MESNKKYQIRGGDITELDTYLNDGNNLRTMDDSEISNWI